MPNLLEAIDLKSRSWMQKGDEIGRPYVADGIKHSIVARSAFLALDRAPATLDVSAQTVILQPRKRLQWEWSMGCSFVSHGLNVVRPLGDRVKAMPLGQVVKAALVDKALHGPAGTRTRGLEDVDEARRVSCHFPAVVQHVRH